MPNTKAIKSWFLQFALVLGIVLEFSLLISQPGTINFKKQVCMSVIVYPILSFSILLWNWYWTLGETFLFKNHCFVWYCWLEESIYVKYRLYTNCCHRLQNYFWFSEGRNWKHVVFAFPHYFLSVVPIELVSGSS